MDGIDVSLSRLYRCGVCGLTVPDFDELKTHMIAAHIPYESGLVDLTSIG